MTTTKSIESTKMAESTKSPKRWVDMMDSDSEDEPEHLSKIVQKKTVIVNAWAKPLIEPKQLIEPIPSEDTIAVDDVHSVHEEEIVEEEVEVHQESGKWETVSRNHQKKASNFETKHFDLNIEMKGYIQDFPSKLKNIKKVNGVIGVYTYNKNIRMVLKHPSKDNKLLMAAVVRNILAGTTDTTVTP